MATNNRPLKAYVRYDGSGRAVSSSLIWRKNKPKVGNWKEVQGYECCNYCKPFDNQNNQVPLSFITGLRYNATTPCATGPLGVYSIVVCNNKLYLFNVDSGELAIDGYYTVQSLDITYQVINGEFTFYRQCF
jgi:hypothetical protein